MEEDHDIPEVGEIVVCKIKQVLNYGAFAELVEYDNKKGFVHVSQVATRWVKNIRNHVKEGQVRGAKVLAINRERNQIDLSLTKVSSNAQRSRIEEWKQLKRCKKLLEILADGQKKSFDEAWDAVAKPLLENNDSLFEGFQEITLHGEKAAEGVEASWVKPLVELVKKSVPAPEKTLTAMLLLKSSAPNGVDLVMKALQKPKKGSVEIFYCGGGKYSVKAKGHDFKSAEKVLNEATDTVIDAIKKSGGEGKVEKGD